MPNHQYSLSLISHKVNETSIPQRASDGYINATEMCRAAGKLMADYLRLGATKDFIAELSSDMGIPISELNQVLKGGDPSLQGTWVHPKVAIHLAQWLSPKFAVQVSNWVYDWMSGKHQPATLPYHLQRHILNLHKVPSGFFSILQEMTNALIAPLEGQGYRMPEQLMPDIAHGKMLCKMLRERHGIVTDTLPTYIHEFPDGRTVTAKLYPLQYLGDFRVMIAEEWLPKKAEEYFKKRDPLALSYLDKMLRISANVKPANLPNYRRAG